MLINLGKAEASCPSLTYQTSKGPIGFSHHTISRTCMVSWSSLSCECIPGPGLWFKFRSATRIIPYDRDPKAMLRFYLSFSFFFLTCQRLVCFSFFLMGPDIHGILSNTCWIGECPLGLSIALLTNCSTCTKLSHNIRCCRSYIPLA